MPNPEGYRKALRVMKLAEKFGRPVLSFIDTPAAFPGDEAEERGQAQAIAQNIAEMSALRVPILVVITGEGGSGGALAIGVGDVVLMLQYAIYTVIPPEGCVAILWRDASRAQEAAEALRLTARDLQELGIIDEIIPEPGGGAHQDPDTVMSAVREALGRHLRMLQAIPIETLLERRYEKYRRMGRQVESLSGARGQGLGI
jgi:acetyl-CoA carboxylase carboxyl transferase subunit alpha